MANSNQATEESRVLFFDDIKRRFGLSETSTRRLVARGILPEPIQLTPRRVGWFIDEFEAALRSMPRGFKRAA